MRFLGKTLVVILAVIGFLSLGLTIAGWYAVKHVTSITASESKAELPKTFVLQLDLDSPLPESDTDPLSSALGASGLTLHRTVDAIDRAAKDPKVKGLVATLATNPLSIADTQELRAALARFRAAGKPTTLFAPTIGEGGHGTKTYYLATAFDSIWLQPSGDLALSGFGVEVPFAHDALEKIGVGLDYGKRWEYKNALDSGIRQTMSTPHRASLQRLLESWRDQVAHGLEQRPDMTPQRARAILDGPPLLGKEALDAGLIDHLGYWDEALDAITKQSKTGDTVMLDDYANSLRPRTTSDSPQIAMITVDGTIQHGSSDPMNRDGVDSDVIANAISDATNDADIKAIVLRINSPGGSYTASDTMWRELILARKAGLPVVVSMGSMAASGGYFIALPATKIYAQPGTITGSVGVFSFKPVLAGLWDKLDINWEEVSLGDYASMDSINHAFTPQQRAVFEKGLDAAYADFTGKVEQGRSLSPEMVDKVARGRIWTGADAKEVGLVDALGGLTDAIAEAKKDAGIDEKTAVRLRPFPEPETPVEAIMKALKMGGLSAAMSTLHTLSTLAEPVAEATRQASISARGPALLAAPLRATP